jgi:hypothetical protein
MEKTTQHPVNRIRLRCVLKDVSPLVARVISVPDDLELRDLHEIFLIMLGWDYDPDFIIRIHAQEFASFRRHSRGKRLRDFQLRRQEKFLYLCDTLDGWEWELRVLDVEKVTAEDMTPICINGRGAAPPAMCGGPTGYRLMLRRQQVGPGLSDPDFISQSVQLLLEAYQNELGVDRQFLEETLHDGWKSVEDRLNRSGPLTPSHFSLKETNDRLVLWAQGRRGWR